MYTRGIPARDRDGTSVRYRLQSSNAVSLSARIHICLHVLRLVGVFESSIDVVCHRKTTSPCLLFRHFQRVIFNNAWCIHATGERWLGDNILYEAGGGG